MGRWLVIGGGVVAAILVAGVYWVVSSLDHLVASAIETYGSEATQTQVSVSGVKISLADGKGTIKGLVVENPDGFKTDHAFRLAGISLELDTSTLASDVIVIKSIKIDSPSVIYEIVGRRSNIDVIQRNLASYGGSSGEASTETSEAPKLVIENLIITGGTVKVSAPGLDPGSHPTAKLPNIHVRNIGKASGGATAAEVTQQILQQLTQGSGRAVSDLGIDALEGVVGTHRGRLEEAGRQLKEGVGGAGEELKKLFK